MSDRPAAKIIQVSDTHFVCAGEALHGLDPRARLDACIADINANHGDAELCVFSGDLTHTGERDAYRHFRECIACIALPYRLMVGNHDDRDNLRAVFPQAPDDGGGFVQDALDFAWGRVILVDTLEPNEDWGSFCERRARWLAERLVEAADRPVYIFMHHPPLNIGTQAWIGLGSRTQDPSRKPYRAAGISATSSSATSTGRLGAHGGASLSRPSGARTTRSPSISSPSHRFRRATNRRPTR